MLKDTFQMILEEDIDVGPSIVALTADDRNN